MGKKLKLEDLKVKSFITSMEKTQKQTIDGGATTLLAGSVTFLISASINLASKAVDTYNTWAEKELASGGCYDTAGCPVTAPGNIETAQTTCTIGIHNCPM